jgi:hypothetical protein
MANIVTNPTADQSIQSHNLLPASGNTTQSLGNSSAPWNGSFNNFAVKTLESILFADQFGPGDLGARINAAFASSSANVEVWVNQNAGMTLSTAVIVPAYCGIRFVQGGTYAISAQIKLSDSSWIVGLPASVNEAGCANIDLLNPSVVLQQGANANLDPVILVAGQNVVLRDFCLDGNAANSSGNSVGIATDTSVSAANSRGRLRMTYVTVQNFHMDNVQIISTDANDQAEAAQLDHCSFSCSQGGSGLRVQQTVDVHINDCQIELNTGWGILLYGSTALITETDVSTNNSGGIYIGGIGTNILVNGGNNSIINCGIAGPSVGSGAYPLNSIKTVTAVSVSAGIATLTCNNSFLKGNFVILYGFASSGGNAGLNGQVLNIFNVSSGSFQVFAPSGVTGGSESAAFALSPGTAGLYIDGYDHVNALHSVCEGNSIIGTHFGFEANADTNGIDAIHIIDSGNNMVANNWIISGNLGGYGYGIYLNQEVYAEATDYVQGNAFFGTFGKTAYNILPNTYFAGNNNMGLPIPSVGLLPLQPNNSIVLNLAPESSSIGSTNMITVPTSGMYRVTWDLICTTAGTTGAQVTLGLQWNNGVGVQTFTSSVVALVTVGTERSGSQLMYITANSNLLYSTTLTKNGNPTYSLYFRVEFLG